MTALRLGQGFHPVGHFAQAFITRGPFNNLGVPKGEGSFYFHADAPTELSALLLVFARAALESQPPSRP